jgi:ribosomal protein S24E
METINDFTNKLLKRRELLVSIEAQKNPSMVEAQELVAGEFKAEKDLIAIKSIRNRFGTHLFEVEAFVYHDAAQKGRVERKPKVKKAPGAA